MKKTQATDFYNKYKLILYPVLVGAIAIVLIYTVIYPQIGKYIKGQEDIKIAEAQIKRLDNKVGILEKTDESSLNVKLDKAVTALPTDKDLATLVGILSELSQKNQIVMSTLFMGGTTGPVSSNGFNPFGVRLELSGSIQSIKNFMTDLEKAPRVMRVGSVEITPSGNASASASTLMVVDVFYLPAPNQLGAVDAALPSLSDQDEAILSSIKLPEPESGPSGEAIVVVKGKADPFK